MKSLQQKIGAAAEKHAEKYLQAQGMKLVSRNYRARCGEIDLIMRDQKNLVFVEVRQRKNTDFGTALDSIISSKRKKLLKTACYYLIQKNIYEKISCRFDVIAIGKDFSDTVWIKNAFSEEIRL